MLLELGEDATVYCGGTELLLAMKLGLAVPSHLVDVKGIPELHGVERREDSLWVGAATCHYQLSASQTVQAALPEMAAMAAEVANVRVRSVGTIGGNLCFADPHSDPATFLIAARARLRCQIGGDDVELAVGEFTTGPYETHLQHGDLLLGLVVPALRDGAGIAHLRMKTHERPTVTVAAMVRVEASRVVDATLAVGSICPVPVELAIAPLLLGARGATLDAAIADLLPTLAASVRLLAGSLDTEAYQRHLTEVFVRRAILSAFARAQR